MCNKDAAAWPQGAARQQQLLFLGMSNEHVSRPFLFHTPLAAASPHRELRNFGWSSN